MSNLGLPELLVVAVVALIVFGPERLPELAKRAGEALSRLRSETTRSVDELKRAADVDGLTEDLKGISRDLREMRSSVTRSLGEAGDDRPPPTDPEAT